MEVFRAVLIGNDRLVEIRELPPGKYNQVGLAMYELPNALFAWSLVLLRPRTGRSPSVEQLLE